MPTTIRLTEELQGRIDRVRGDVPRERFARSLLGEALDAREAQQLVEDAPPLLPSREAERRADTEVQRGVDAAHKRSAAAAALDARRLARASDSSSAAKAGVTPRPKGGKA